MPALCDRCQVFGHGSSNCKFNVDIENEDSRGEEDCDVSGSERGSSGSDEWVRSHTHGLEVPEVKGNKASRGEGNGAVQLDGSRELPGHAHKGGVNDGKRAKEFRGSVTVIDHPSSSRDLKGLKFKMEPMESDSAKVKGEKLENEQNLGDAIGGDEVGDCSFEAVTAIPLAEVTKRVLSNKFQAAVTKSGNSGEKSRSNRFHSLITPDADDYEVCFPSLSSSNPKIQKEIRSPDLFFDVDDVKISLLKMIRDFSLDRRSRSTIFAVVKELEDEVNIAQGVPNDPARLASLEARINRLKRLSPNQLVKELNLKFCPLTSSGGVFPLTSGKAISAKDTLVDEVTEATVGKTEHFLSSGPQRCEGYKGVGDVEAVVQPGGIIPRPPSSDEPPSSEADDDGDTGSDEVGTTSGEEDCDTEGGGDSSASGVSIPSHSLTQGEWVKLLLKMGKGRNRLGPNLATGSEAEDLVGNRSWADIVGSSSKLKVDEEEVGVSVRLLMKMSTITCAKGCLCREVRFIEVWRDFYRQSVIWAPNRFASWFLVWAACFKWAEWFVCGAWAILLSKLGLTGGNRRVYWVGPFVRLLQDTSGGPKKF
ncbi:hypothetical protein U1Q18_032676 [Sarracenia purpurea var. burkii]